jgi:hypothetical protein
MRARSADEGDVVSSTTSHPPLIGHFDPFQANDASTSFSGTATRLAFCSNARAGARGGAQIRGAPDYESVGRITITSCGRAMSSLETP